MPEKIEEYTSVESLLRDIVGFAKESLIDESFTKNKTKIIIRRIMQYSNVRQEYSIPVWDILDIEPDMNNVTASISKMREETQKSSEKYRWIPNTGEYLMLGGIHMTVRNKAGIILQGNKYRVSFLGAIDRNFVNTENGSSDNGNINTNKAERFLIKFFSGKNEIEQGKIYKEKINNQYSGNYRYVMDYSSNNMIPSYFTIGKGGLLYANKNPLMIAIRPESSEKAYPGDDLLLNFSTVATLESNVVSKGIIVNEQDYVAVYDKKMLWRANLYIDLKEPELNDLDWNNAHPWNAPADTTVAINKTPEWWDAVTENGSTLSANQKWGFNEWNTPEKDYKGTKGGQVVSIPSTKWCYGYDGKSQHQITKAVAYDHQGWDSPFSFISKIESQKQLLNQWYTSNGEKFGNPVYKWPKNCTNLSDYKKYLGEKICGSETDLDKLKELYDNYRNNSSQRWRGELDSLDYSKYIFSKNYGDKTKVPYNDYGNFKASFISNVTKNIGNVTGGNEDAVSISGKTYYPYIPGLSDSLMTTLSDYPSSEIGKITAGVDCTGFVMSSAGYSGEQYKAMPAASIPKPIFWEDKTIPTPIQRAWHSEGNAVKVGDWNTKKDIDYKKDNGELDSKSVYSYYTHLVPGDIVWYSGHIMIVSSITEPDGNDKEGNPYWNDGSGVTVLESVYNNPKTEYKLVGNYSITKKRNLYQLLKIGRYWEIWRQK